MNALTLTFPMGYEFQRLHCPVCGAPILEPGKPFEEPNCIHVEWVYLEEVSEFIYVAPSVKQAIEQVDSDEDPGEDKPDHPVERLAALWKSATRGHIEVSTGAMACGPVWTTVYFGINFMQE